MGEGGEPLGDLWGTSGQFAGLVLGLPFSGITTLVDLTLFAKANYAKEIGSKIS